MVITETLEANIEKGWFVVDNTLVTQQSIKIFDAFKKLFIEKKPKQILEIGAQAGGLTLCIGYMLNELNMNETKILSYDIKEIQGIDFIASKFNNINFKIENLFTDSYLQLQPEKIDYIKTFIQQSGTTIVLCDGGSKKNEFRLISSYLKQGDIIMAHDYSPNSDYFASVTKPNKIWHWHEIDDNDVSDSMKNNNLSFYMHEIFRDAAWLCTVKNEQ